MEDLETGEKTSEDDAKSSDIIETRRFVPDECEDSDDDSLARIGTWASAAASIEEEQCERINVHASQRSLESVGERMVRKASQGRRRRSFDTLNLTNKQRRELLQLSSSRDRKPPSSSRSRKSASPSPSPSPSPSHSFKDLGAFVKKMEGVSKQSRRSSASRAAYRDSPIVRSSSCSDMVRKMYVASDYAPEKPIYSNDVASRYIFDDHSIPEGKEDNFSKTYYVERKLLCLVLLFSVLMLSFATVTLIRSSSSQNIADETRAGSNTDTVAYEDDQLQSIPNDPSIPPNSAPAPPPDLGSYTQALIISISSKESLNDKNSPQYKAYQYLSSSPEVDRLSQSKILQRYILATFFYSLNGPEWNSSWLQPQQDECSWEGITCTNISHSHLDSSATSINITNPYLAGTLPSELSHLTSLTRLILPKNKIDGAIPSQITQLTQLTNLDLSYNRLSGKIPPDIFHIVSLQFLNLSYNHLSGSIPASIGNLPNISTIDLSNNQLSGILPLSISELLSLSHLILDDNDIEGTLPSLLADNLLSLQVLSVSNNELIGEIPSDIGNLQNLQVLRLNRNAFTGEIPVSIEDLTQIQEMKLEQNDLQGTVPNTFCHLTSLDVLTADCVGIAPKVTCSCCTMCYNV